MDGDDGNEEDAISDSQSEGEMEEEEISESYNTDPYISNSSDINVDVMEEEPQILMEEEDSSSFLN